MKCTLRCVVMCSLCLLVQKLTLYITGIYFDGLDLHDVLDPLDNDFYFWWAARFGHSLNSFVYQTFPVQVTVYKFNKYGFTKSFNKLKRVRSKTMLCQDIDRESWPRVGISLLVSHMSITWLIHVFLTLFHIKKMSDNFVFLRLNFNYRFIPPRATNSASEE